MDIKRTTKLTFFRALGILVLGLMTGVQMALYLYDYYDDGIADIKSLLIGIAMLLFAIGFIIYTFKTDASEKTIS